MIITLNEEEKALLENKSNYTPLSKNKEFNTPKEEYIVTSYNKGVPVTDIAKEAKVSMGLIYTVLNFYKVPKKHKKSRVAKRVKHITNDKNKVQALIKDYQYMDLQSIYKKYNIHKNGLYYILDLYNIERKSDLKEKALEDTIEVE
ncbi:hypothetical protein SPJ221_165 [Staphylococcus phage vB_SauH_SPJ2]|uniref:Uncharacterized protein n=6 Tax=Silviavirus TaxID=1857889 RepID=S4T9B6_9CAUD|nr:DNA binding protein [Staphylococcus phage SA11]YP_007677587.1 hypothetical protein QLX36_gp083 [Staphylococcus phage vB_SauM_Romulus]YP_008431217.1 DNA binding protein [Staphylococcus phage vB_SauM_Remus]APC42992.1 hypothetical protein SAP1_127 [Staphylococcus phage StAP1]QQO38059.1 hypothetical protein LSA2308_00039 [Staphylococcus phage LSA2308]QVD57576.1 hypothetical protein PM56_031 [Staphylococcus phage PM56]QVD58469.1 hypothetical protein PM93_042 [Staphylococcus phage PM93]QVD58672